MSKQEEQNVVDGSLFDAVSNSKLDELVNDNNINNIISGIDIDNEVEDMEEPVLDINMSEINSEAQSEAKEITERLSGYYFDQKYIDTHPYVPIKIKCEMNNIRRLIKMLQINEKAQDALIQNITFNAGKGALYSALTSPQNSTLSIQSQLNTLTESLENIFRKMQDECDRTWSDKEKESAADGSMVVRGSREFIELLSKGTGTDN